jgi:prefoldin subunit 5
VVASVQPTREDLEEIISTLRDEISRLKEEIRRIRRETNEVPPHYL